MPKQILRLPDVKARTGLSRTTIYMQISEGAFPKQISLGSRSVGWLEEDVENWLCERVRQSRLCGDGCSTRSSAASGVKNTEAA